MSGYSQAVENLAYVIDKTASETMDHLVEQYGFITAEEAARFMSQEELKAWEEIEKVADIICKTYDVEYETLMADASAVLMANLLANELGLH